MIKKVNLPHVDAIIGPPLKKGEYNGWLQHMRDDLREGGKKIKDWEIPKTKRDHEIIAFVQEVAWSYLRHFGRSKRIIVPMKNIHLLKVGGTKASSDGELADGMHTDTTGSIKVDRFESDTLFALTLFHELYHLGAYKVFRMFRLRKVQRLSGWRQGISSSGGRGGHKKYFKWAEEAVIEYMTHRFYREHLRNHIDFPRLKGLLKLNRQGELDDLKEFARIACTTSKKRRWKIKNSTRVIHLFCVAQSTGRWLPIARLTRQVFDDPQFFRKMAEYDS